MTFFKGAVVFAAAGKSRNTWPPVEFSFSALFTSLFPFSRPPLFCKDQRVIYALTLSYGFVRVSCARKSQNVRGIQRFGNWTLIWPRVRSAEPRQIQCSVVPDRPRIKLTRERDREKPTMRGTRTSRPPRLFEHRGFNPHNASRLRETSRSRVPARKSARKIKLPTAVLPLVPVVSSLSPFPPFFSFRSHNFNCGEPQFDERLPCKLGKRSVARRDSFFSLDRLNRAT